MNKLTARQYEILDYIISEVEQKGYPPTVREIGAAVGLSSSSTVHAHLNILEQLGYIRRDPTKPRTIEILCHTQFKAKQIIIRPNNNSEQSRRIV